jgi:hypothetical protein
VATAGDLLQWHPYLHLLTTDAGRVDGAWHPLPEWDSVRLMTPRLRAPAPRRHVRSRRRDPAAPQAAMLMWGQIAYRSTCH